MIAPVCPILSKIPLVESLKSEFKIIYVPLQRAKQIQK
jgi:hypothetical protein